ncbi:protein draper-like [Dreissena polymorpha]|uniref:F5/8 type C domain-containing protein n=1 Tax=Dreissena polymorpha TaxID=45954 RepID=A0A9D3YXJ1_DREPO|nr:protein draper-like [Dreissena polymorpha]KAH3708913.1 hypothetical protein DPMN_068372 [Dreissena polymorpha]
MATKLLAICAVSLIAKGNSTCPETKYLVSGKRPIPDEYLTASSELHPENSFYEDHSPGRSRLDTKGIYINGIWLSGGWSAQTSDDQQWIQARFWDLSYITGIVTQGRNIGKGSALYQRVTSYQFHFSQDCVKFVTLRDPNDDNEIFPGNTDQDSHVTIMLPSPVRALCVRIQPVTWVEHITLRFDVLGCSCGSVLCLINCYCDNCTNCGTECQCTCPKYCERKGASHSCFADGTCRYGCTENHYGPVCDKKCSPYCAISSTGDVCSNDGSCLYGCVANHYGSQCKHICPMNCALVDNRTRCDDKGVCVDGCAPDFFGRQCNNPCPTNCAAGANGSMCDQQGVCVHGCANDHFDRKCSNLCPTSCAPVAGGSRCSDSGSCTMGCIAGYSGDTCEPSIKISEESVSRYKSGMIESLIVAVTVVALVTIAVMICFLRKKRLTCTDVVNRSMSDRTGPAELNQHSIDTFNACCTLGTHREEAELLLISDNQHSIDTCNAYCNFDTHRDEAERLLISDNQHNMDTCNA